MKTLLSDLAAGLLFFAVLLITKNILIATGVGMAVGVAQIGRLRIEGHKVQPIQWLSLGLVIGLGGATLITRQPLFVMLKPSLVELALSAIMLKPGWLGRYLPAHRLAQLPARAVVITGYVYAGVMVALAAANLAVALATDPQTWAAYNAVAPPAVFATVGLGVYLSFKALAARARRAGQIA